MPLADDPPASPTAPGRAYAETLRVPLRWWAVATTLLASLLVAMLVALPATLAFAVGGAASILVAAILVSYGGARVEVDERSLRAGRARIELRWLSAPQALDAELTRLLAGPRADARAYLLLRPYCDRAVRVDVDDPDDPAPYWLISTRRPDALAAALRRGTVSAQGHRAD